MKLKDLKKLLETATDNTEIKVKNGEIVIIEPEPIEYKFNVGDKVRNIILPRLEYIVKERCYTKGKIIYTLKSEFGETIHSEEYLEFIPQDITERIKTFEDAVEWCKENGEANLVNHYDDWEIYNDTSKDIIAYLKLRIITAALNEGWEPTFAEDEERWYICADEECGGPCMCSSDGIITFTESSRLLFKSDKLAEYAAEQFRDLYADFCGCEKGGEA